MEGGRSGIIVTKAEQLREDMLATTKSDSRPQRGAQITIQVEVTIPLLEKEKRPMWVTYER